MFHETLCLPTRKVEHKINFIFFSGLEQRFYQTDLDCISAGKPLPEFDLYISTVLPLENKGIRYGKTLFIVYQLISITNKLHKPAMVYWL